MKYEIVKPRPMPQDESLQYFFKRERSKDDIFIDFSDEKIEKALFLDIDGVIQAFTENRFEYIRDEIGMEKLFVDLEKEFNCDYRTFDLYDLTAVVYDWDKEAVQELKRVLDTTGAKFVVSSDWRYDSKLLILPFLFRIHDLEKYLYGYTPIFFDIQTIQSKPENEKIYWHRSIEILEYIKAHPHIKKWVAVDDLDMSRDIPDNFVGTYPKLTSEKADKCIEILMN